MWLILQVSIIIGSSSVDSDESVRQVASSLCAEFGRHAPKEMITELAHELLHKVPLYETVNY